MVLPENGGARGGRAEGRMVCVWPTLPHSQKKVKSTPSRFCSSRTVPDKSVITRVPLTAEAPRANEEEVKPVRENAL